MATLYLFSEGEGDETKIGTPAGADYDPIVSDTGTGTDKISLAIPFSDTITNLSDLTVYYFRAKIQDSTGYWYYGEEKQFQTEEKPYIPKTVPDTGLGTDEIPSIEKNIAITDTGSISAEDIAITRTHLSYRESRALLAKAKIVDDTGTFSDVIFVESFITITDSSTSQEDILIDKNVLIYDSGTGTEAYIRDKTVLILSDSGSGIEETVIQGSFAITDLGSGDDILNILSELTLTDEILGTENLKFETSLVLSDYSTEISDIVLVSVAISVEESVQGIGKIAIYCELPVISDSSSGPLREFW